MAFQDLIIPVATIVGAAGTFGALADWGYSRLSVKVPPNKALVLYGRREASGRGESVSGSTQTELRRPRIIVGGRVFVAPWSKGVGYLSLEPVIVDLTVRSMQSFAHHRVTGWEAGVRVQVKIPAEASALQAAAENLLGKTDEEVRTVVRRSVEGWVPTVLARIPAEDSEPDWEHVAAEIQAAVAPDLVAWGLIVRSLALTELRRIGPAEPEIRETSAALPGRLATASAGAERLITVLSSIEERLARVERATVAALPPKEWRSPAALVTEASPPESILDLPLGYEVDGPDGPSIVLRHSDPPEDEPSSAAPPADPVGWHRAERPGPGLPWRREP